MTEDGLNVGVRPSFAEPRHDNARRVEIPANDGLRIENDSEKPTVFAAVRNGTTAPRRRPTSAANRKPTSSPKPPKSAPSTAHGLPPETNPSLFQFASSGLRATRSPAVRRAKVKLSSPSMSIPGQSPAVSPDPMAWSPIEQPSSGRNASFPDQNPGNTGPQHPAGDLNGVVADLNSKLNFEEQKSQTVSSEELTEHTEAPFGTNFSFSAQKGETGAPLPHRTKAKEKAGGMPSKARGERVFELPSSENPLPPFNVPGGSEVQGGVAVFSGTFSATSSIPGAPLRRHLGGRRHFARAAAVSKAPSVDHSQNAPREAQPTHAASAAILATAERHRAAGNEAFRSRDYSSAHSRYGAAINAILLFLDEKEESVELDLTTRTALALLCCNRAAAALTLHRPLEALQDCRLGLRHNPEYLKCSLRMVTCHCRLGEFAQAREILCRVHERVLTPADLNEVRQKEADVEGSEKMLFNALRDLGCDVSSHAHGKTFIPSNSKQACSLLEVLEELQNVSKHCPYADVIHAATANVLVRLGKFNEAARVLTTPPHKNADEMHLSPWRVWLRAQVLFFEGQVTKLLSSLEIVEEKYTAGSGDEHLDIIASVIPRPERKAVTAIIRGITEMERLRSDGNKAMGAKRFDSAEKRYSSALTSGLISAGMAAVLHCNRAAAHQGLGNLALAIADCCRAKSLEPSYAKAYSRLATILSELEMHAAAGDALTAALESPSLDPAARNEYRRRLQTAREMANRRRRSGEKVPNYYKLLGLEGSCAVSDVRKTYKKLALQLHPDKAASACKFCCQLGEHGLNMTQHASEIRGRLLDSATWLFKLLGEAHEGLTDDNKRRELNEQLEEDRFTSYGHRNADFYYASSSFYPPQRPSYHYYGRASSSYRASYQNHRYY